MVDKVYDIAFDNPHGERPYMIYPKVFGDSRGHFTEVLAGDSMNRLKQINRSSSCQLTVRGLHAQAGAHCQSKIVEALTLPIYDIIVDARPDSMTFGTAGVYLLDPIKQNKLFAPHGFLHGFAVPRSSSSNGNAVFMYYCDEVYCRESEVHANPMTLLPALAASLRGSSEHAAFVKMLGEDASRLVLSEKDLNAEDYEAKMKHFLAEYNESGKLWYRA